MAFLLAMTLFSAMVFLPVMAAFPALVGLDIGRLAHAVGKAVRSGQHILAWDIGAKVGVGGQLCRQRCLVASADGQPAGAEQGKCSQETGKKTGRINHGKTSEPLNIERNKRNQAAAPARVRISFTSFIAGARQRYPIPLVRGTGPPLKPRQSCGCASPGAGHDRSGCSTTSRPRACRR